MTSAISYALYCLCCLTCCLVTVVLLLAIIGSMFMKKKGKKPVSIKEAVVAGAEVSRAYVRGGKSREQLLAEEDEEEKRR
jgi:H2-forming N5,N10-methylenetetrahydromethanopterin dehydrogenase-like enzyme